jgi:hypothetical protein
MAFLVCFLEERSSAELLKAVLPRILPEDTGFQCIVFEGKQDLEKQLLRKMRGWRIPDSRFLIMRDQDQGDCRLVKKRLIDQIEAGSGEKSRPFSIRIACHSLESFYLGDLAAVEKGLSLHGLAGQQDREKFRDPDRLANPTQELGRLTSDRYQKVAGSRSIARYLKLDGSNRSASFRALIQGIRKLCGDGSNN